MEPIKEKQYQLIAFNCRYSHSCLALYYVRNELERRLPGCRARISQLTINDPYYPTLLNIIGSASEVLFFSVYIWNAAYMARLLGDLARIQPDRPIILGGPQAPFLMDLPAQCSVVHGEIEGVDASFYRDLAGRCLEPAYETAGGRPFFSPYRQEDLAGDLRNRQIYYESSRGCPFSCSYCLSSVKNGVLHKDIEEVKQELAEILVARPRIIKFVDRTFNADTGRALALWEFLASKEGPTRFHFEIAPDRFTEEMFRFLATLPPDLFQFEIGIQSCHQETLAAVNRRMDVELAAANIKRLAALDAIHLHVDLILGLPHETEESFQASFNRVFSMVPHYIQMGLLKVLPETSIRRGAPGFDMIYCGQPPYEILATRWLDHQTLGDLYFLGECVEAFYNNRFFCSIWRYLRRTQEEPYGFFRTLLALCRLHDFFNLASTQKLMSRMLFETARTRPDGELMSELLRYDWLRCGHRFLPEYLEKTPLTALRNELWQKLPQNLDGCFTHRDRDEFFKRGVFLRVSGEALVELGLGSGEREETLCFLPEQTTGVLKHNRVMVLDEI
jgi:anaerobic magnesium-protoporphyrin IX monomethyl ester cyclase